MADDSFTFPKLQPQLQNPILAKATVIDKTTTTNSNASNSQSAVRDVEQQQPLSDQPRPRKKFMYEKGYSQMDWVRLSATQGKDLAGLGGGKTLQGITLDEVAKHNTKADAWMVLRGKVYNITPYMKFHPGGEPMLMKAAGKDGTALFNKYHAWVNADFLLSKCLVGTLA